MPSTTTTTSSSTTSDQPSTKTHRSRTALAEEKRSISSRRRLNAEQTIRKAQQVGGDTYFIKKSPFGKLVRHQLRKRTAKSDQPQVSNSAIDTFRHAIERTLGAIIHDADNARSLSTHGERDTIFWTDILAALGSSKVAPQSVQRWLANEQALFNEASDKRRLTKALASQLGRYVKNQNE